MNNDYDEITPIIRNIKNILTKLQNSNSGVSSDIINITNNLILNIRSGFNYDNFLSSIKSACISTKTIHNTYENLLFYIKAIKISILLNPIINDYNSQKLALKKELNIQPINMKCTSKLFSEGEYIKCVRYCSNYNENMLKTFHNIII